MRYFTNCGSPIKEVRRAIVNESGVTEVIVVGKENLQDYIDSFADSCNVQLLVSRAVNGQPELLKQRIGYYGDFTQFPHTYAEVIQKVNDAKEIFEMLPKENKAEFGFDFNKFISSFGDDDFLMKAGFVKNTPVDSTEEGDER